MYHKDQFLVQFYLTYLLTTYFTLSWKQTFATLQTITLCILVKTHWENVIKRLTADIKRINKWFINNSLVANPEKFQMMFLGVSRQIILHIDGNKYPNKDFVKLLGVYIDSKLTFRKHIEMTCKNANNKISQLYRLRLSMNTDQIRSVVNTYILISYFLYCPLIWMFCRKKDMKLINRVHKRALRVIHGNSY